RSITRFPEVLGGDISGSGAPSLLVPEGAGIPSSEIKKGRPALSARELGDLRHFLRQILDALPMAAQRAALPIFPIVDDEIGLWELNDRIARPTPKRHIRDVAVLLLHYRRREQIVIIGEVGS